ncbi:MAG: class I SAM-dependent methyltransferase, partial [Thiothrix sp.]|nr:class I SAM-dependent methyltransferase [Thiothrix sp.]
VFLLEKLSHQHIKTVMEVGCNVGITLDYCKTNWNLEKVIGIEPSAYGLLGKQLLDLEIYHEFLENLPEIRGTAFDLIFATEVLEHVPTPLDFIRLLRGHLKPQGILLLTTPRSGFLEPSAPTGELYAALSPGSHYFLLSENKLRELAFEAGFQFVHIEPFGMTHVAILANTEIRLSNPGNTEIKLLDYYQKKQENLPTDERLKLGYYLNYAIHLSKTGHHKQLMADTVLNQSIQVMLSGKYALDLRNLHTSIERITSCISIFDLAKQMPFNLPHYLYWQAFSSKKVHQWTDQLIQQLEFARLVCLTGLKVDFQNLFVYHELLNRIDTALEHIPQTPSSMQIKKCSENIRRKIPELNQDTPKHFIRRIKERLKRYRYTW